MENRILTYVYLVFYFLLVFISTYVTNNISCLHSVGNDGDSSNDDNGNNISSKR